MIGGRHNIPHKEKLAVLEELKKKFYYMGKYVGLIESFKRKYRNVL